MIRRIARYLTILFILGAVLYVILMNREPMTVRISETDSYTAMGGVVLTAVYILGLLSAGAIALFFGIKNYFRERSFVSREKSRTSLLESIAEARSLVAAEEWARARREYESIIKRHPQDAPARVELSKVLEHLGDAREALQVLDAARIAHPENVEVLFRAAELNIALKNRTAAIDNLALILYREPNRRAARMARDLSEELDRFDDALEYESRLQNMGLTGDDHESTIGRIEFKRLVKECGSDREALRTKTLQFVKRRTTCLPALLELARLEFEAGRRDEAAQWYVKAARESEDLSLWRKASSIWLASQNSQAALAAARAATKESRGPARLNAELELIRVYIALNMLDEARGAIQKFEGLARDFEVIPSTEARRELLALDGLCSAKFGDKQRTADALKALSEGATTLETNPTAHLNGVAQDAPAPRLSTP